MICNNCPTVPIVSSHLTAQVLRGKAKETWGKALIASMSWLLERHPGLEIYEGINGRPYTIEERSTIALETGLVERLGCPLRTETGCILGGLGPHYNPGDEAKRGPYVFLPTAIARMLAPNELKNLVASCAVADAKVMVLTRNSSLPTREMLVGASA